MRKALSFALLGLLLTSYCAVIAGGYAISAVGLGTFGKINYLWVSVWPINIDTTLEVTPNDVVDIQNKIDIAPTSGAIINIPSGIYNLPRGFTIQIFQKSKIKLKGPADLSAKIIVPNDQDGFEIVMSSIIVFENLWIESQKGDGYDECSSIRFQGCSRCQVINCRFQTAHGYGVRLILGNGVGNNEIDVVNSYFYDSGHNNICYGTGTTGGKIVKNICIMTTGGPAQENIWVGSSTDAYPTHHVLVAYNNVTGGKDNICLATSETRCTYVEITRNNCTDATYRNIYVVGALCTIKFNQLANPGSNQPCISLSGLDAQNTTVYRNRLSNGRWGIWGRDCSGSNVSENRIINNSDEYSIQLSGQACTNIVCIGNVVKGYVSVPSHPTNAISDNLENIPDTEYQDFPPDVP